MEIISTDQKSKKSLWAGRILSAIAILFLLFDSITKIMMTEFVVKATVQLGFPAEDVFIFGIILLTCLILYVIPATSILGAILLTGYLGGAVVTNMRMGTPLFSNILFPVYMGIIVWGGLFLRDNTVSRIIPIKRI